MNYTPDGPAADPPDPTSGTPDAVDASSVPPPRTGLEPLPRRVRGASGVATDGSTADAAADAETLHRLLTGLRDI